MALRSHKNMNLTNRMNSPSRPGIPDGFEPAPLDEGFLNLIGPLHARRAGNGTYILALRATPDHANRYGVVHGGLLSTLADVAIGMNLARVTSTVEVTLTLNLSLDFISQARQGDWIEAHVELNKEGGRVRFGQCRIVVGEKLVVRGTAVFYVP